MKKFVLCIHHESGIVGKRLLKSIREKFQDVEQERLGSVEELKKRLCAPAYGKENEIIIALVDSSERLGRLIELKRYLEDRRVVLILLEENREILSRCHLLRPRYVSHGENNFSDVLPVLEKMISAMRQHDSGGGNDTVLLRETSRKEYKNQADKRNFQKRSTTCKY